MFNLSFEMQFIKELLADKFGELEVFATDTRKPLYFATPNGLEFRCAYRLTNMTLQKACENEKGVIHRKAAGDLDYSVLRTAETPLDNTEFGYCIADVVSLYELIQNKMINEGDNITTIPLTSTGYVRRDCRNAARKEPNYRHYFKANRLESEVYQLLIEAGRGGNTHANRFLSGRILHEVDSADVVSSYPANMLLWDEFPITKFTYYGEGITLDDFNYYIENNACLFRAYFENINLKSNIPMPYIPTSKCRLISCARYDNGRVLKADRLEITLTNIDWEIVKAQYHWDNVAITEFHFAEKGALPEALRGQVMEYFITKTELKDKIKNANTKTEREDLEYLYAKSKNRLNGIFGMCYTNPVHDTFKLCGNDWISEKANIEESLERYNKSRNSFLVYAHGIFITALARRHLEWLLNATGTNTIYCDTDSSKFITTPEIRQKIESLNARIIEQCEKKSAYYDCNGKRYYMGIYEIENDEPLSEFKTLGAKKYCYVENDELHVTISGVNKKLGASELGNIKNFTPGFIFKEAGGKTLYYNDEGIHTITINGCTMLTASNIGMVESTYELGITNEYAELIGYNLIGDIYE